MKAEENKEQQSQGKKNGLGFSVGFFWQKYISSVSERLSKPSNVFRSDILPWACERESSRGSSLCFKD